LYLQTPTQDLVAHCRAVALVRGEEVVGDVDLVEAEAADGLELIGHLAGAAIAHFGTDHFAADTEDALVGAPAGGGHADGHPQRAVAAEGQEAARRRRQAVQIGNEPAGRGEADRAVGAKGDSRDVLEAAAGCGRPDQFDHRPFPFPQHSDIQRRAGLQSLRRTECDMRPAHDRHGPRVVAFDIVDHHHGVVNGHGDGGEADKIRLKIIEDFREHFRAVWGDHQVQHADVDPGLFQGCGEIGETQRRGGGLGDGVEGVDQKYAHGRCFSKI
jgi:hypothetical protein